ncbi:MAG: hypothetical protein JW973_11825, partial [Bacteroidales bacterium]|nr:hypothetical protein [Bacteroidales bacterium]
EVSNYPDSEAYRDWVNSPPLAAKSKTNCLSRYPVRLRRGDSFAGITVNIEFDTDELWNIPVKLPAGYPSVP